MDPWLLSAAALSLFTAGVHLFAGGAAVARPLLASRELDPVVKYTAYYCWHLVSLVLVAMPIGFGVGAVREESRELAVLMTALAAAFGLLSVWLVVWTRLGKWRLPQWALFVPIALLGAVGLWR